MTSKRNDVSQLPESNQESSISTDTEKTIMPQKSMINKSQKINPQDSSRNEGHKSLFSKRRITRERKSVCMWRVRDLVVKRDTSVGTNALFASTESPEILGRPRNDVVVKLHHYSPFQLFPYAYVKIASWPPHLSLYNFLPQGLLSTQIRKWRRKTNSEKPQSRFLFTTPHYSNASLLSSAFYFFR